ncbi:B12-binding domain-containing radical SAM protein [Nocardia sp. NPDC057227]|uniref:B12-binding domain-containing radical SAM protein n=1 Tax=Nocardia sp. NPDC057227 TaxID=3346056 RepID=UPI00363F7FF3
MLEHPHHTRILELAHRLDIDHTALARVLAAHPPEQPGPLTRALSTVFPGAVVLTGTLQHRLLPAEDPDRPASERWLAAELSGAALRQRDWPAWARGSIGFTDPSAWCSHARIDAAALHRLTSPNVLLAALYHPDHFPLPRFPLAISDLARAVRSNLSGTVTLMDMQLGTRLDDILDTVEAERPDILGVSATFGQHDLLTTLLDTVAAAHHRPMVVAGGSLVARNEQLLLRDYPWLLIARGAGEPTLADLVAHWHGDLDRDQIRGIGYTGAARGEATHTIGRFRRTATVANRAQTDYFPELDLLDATFTHRGVAQLESSRGCTNFCSFCPRGHKGQWSGIAATELPEIVAAIGEVFDRHPQVSRTLYLVDEEFIGRGPDAATRAVAVAEVLHTARLRWETSCRVDQVTDPARDRAWHLDRARMWRALRARGLRRCLFGIESGVTSILARFNKQTVAEQNALAIRTLSALGIATRFTYITFDHLMTAEELRATRDFLARTDLLLAPDPDLAVEDIVDGVHDQRFLARHATGAPFYTAVSYMLVSMECLIGAAYTKQVHAAGRAGEVRPSMGRLDAEFADWRIGVCSHHAQLWVDHNFALDYTLKSLEKVLDGATRHHLRAARTVLKDAAFTLLDDMIELIDRYDSDHRESAAMGTALIAAMHTRREALRETLAAAVCSLTPALTASDAELLRTEHRRWNTERAWTPINAADPCGT